MSEQILAFPVAPNNLAGMVAANIRAEVSRRGFKQSDLARALKVNRSTVNPKWNGSRAWQLDEIEQVAEMLGVTPSTLIETSSAARQEGLEPPTFWLGVNNVVDLDAYRERRAA